MTFLSNHASNDDPLTRVLFYSIVLHYAAFFVFFGNPFLLIRFDKAPKNYGMQKEFDIQLLALPGTEGPLPRQQALGLFPSEPKTESGGKEKRGGGLNPHAFHNQPSELNEPPDPERLPELDTGTAVKAVGGDGEQLRIGSIQHEGKAPLNEDPPPLVTSKKLPPNMTGPEDCMIKVVGMVCPNADAKCIDEYKAFCASLPK